MTTSNLIRNTPQTANKPAIIDSNLVPGTTTGNWVKHNTVFDSDPQAPSCENMTSSTKLEDTTYCIVVREGPSHGKR